MGGLKTRHEREREAEEKMGSQVEIRKRKKRGEIRLYGLVIL